VAICPELSVSSFGDSVEEARKSLREAIDLSIEECEEMDTLSAVLREAGFIPDSTDPQKWVSRVPILVEQATSDHQDQPTVGSSNPYQDQHDYRWDEPGKVFRVIGQDLGYAAAILAMRP